MGLFSKKKGGGGVFGRRRSKEAKAIAEDAKKAAATAAEAPEKQQQRQRSAAAAAVPPPPSSPSPTIPQSLPATKDKASSVKDSKTKKKDGNWFTKSKHFEELSNWAFETIDADKSGSVDKKELYTGLLMIHLKLATYAGPAACRPATREYVEKIFDKMDADNSGCLDHDEFMDVMAIVCSQVFTRVVIQWTMTLMIVPLIAQGIIKLLCTANDKAWEFWMNAEELEPLRDSVGDVTGRVWDKVADLTPELVKSYLGKAGGALGGVWDKIPDGVKETLPVTLMSCVLGCIAVPYMLYKIDCFYEDRAERKAKEKEAAAKKTA